MSKAIALGFNHRQALPCGPGHGQPVIEALHPFPFGRTVPSKSVQRFPLGLSGEASRRKKWKPADAEPKSKTRWGSSSGRVNGSGAGSRTWSLPTHR